MPFCARYHSSAACDDVLGAGLLDLELELLVQVPVDLVVDVEVVRRGRSGSRARTRRRTLPWRSPSPSGAWPPSGSSARAGIRRSRARRAGTVACPVRMFVWDGSVMTLCECACVKTRPSAANRSRFGVVPRVLPSKPDGVVAQRVDRDEDDVAGDPRTALPRAGRRRRPPLSGSARERAPAGGAVRGPCAGSGSYPRTNERARPEFPDGPSKTPERG